MFICVVFDLHTEWSNANYISASITIILPTKVGTFHGMNCFSHMIYMLQTCMLPKYHKTFYSHLYLAILIFELGTYPFICYTVSKNFCFHILKETCLIIRSAKIIIDFLHTFSKKPTTGFMNLPKLSKCFSNPLDHPLVFFLFFFF